jgi:hypothetical protein
MYVFIETALWRFGAIAHQVMTCAMKAEAAATTGAAAYARSQTVWQGTHRDGIERDTDPHGGLNLQR